MTPLEEMEQKHEDEIAKFKEWNKITKSKRLTSHLFINKRNG